jgi:hypothetical protein
MNIKRNNSPKMEFLLKHNFAKTKNTNCILYYAKGNL